MHNVDPLYQQKAVSYFIYQKLLDVYTGCYISHNQAEKFKVYFFSVIGDPSIYSITWLALLLSDTKLDCSFTQNCAHTSITSIVFYVLSIATGKNPILSRKLPMHVLQD